MDIKLTQDKAGRLDYSESLMTHAMVLTGVDLDEMVSQPSGRLKTHGETRLVQMVTFLLLQMLGWTNTLIKIVVRKELLTAEEQAAYEAEPIVLAPWDPMGAWQNN